MGDTRQVRGSSKNSKRVNGVHIKHSATQTIPSVTERETTFLVKSSTPFISAVKRIVKILKKFDKSVLPLKRYQNGEYKKVKYLTVQGMGKSIEKTISIGCHFRDKLGYKVDVLTGSVEVLDEFQNVRPPSETKEADSKDTADLNGEASSDDSEDGERVFKKRMVSSVEIRIWLRRE